MISKIFSNRLEKILSSMLSTDDASETLLSSKISSQST